MFKSYPISKRIGLIVSLAFAVLYCNIQFSFPNQTSFVDRFFNVHLITLFLSTVFLLTSFFNNKFSNHTQLLFIYISSILCMYTGDIFSTFSILGIIVTFGLSQEYGIFKKHFILKLVILSVITLFFFVHSIILNFGINRIAELIAIMVFSIILILAVYIDKIKKLNQDIKELKPLSTLGKNAQHVIHSLKAISCAIESCVMNFQTDYDSYMELLKESSAELNNRISNILDYSSSRQSSTFDASRVIAGLIKIIEVGSNNVIKSNLEELTLNVNIFDFKICIENLIKNGCEANTNIKIVNVTCNKDKIEISDNGKGFVKGWQKNKSTKSSGHGIGMSDIFDFVHQNDWKMNINSTPTGSTITLYPKILDK